MKESVQSKVITRAIEFINNNSKDDYKRIGSAIIEELKLLSGVGNQLKNEFAKAGKSRLDKRTPKEIIEIYDMVGDEVTKAIKIIQKKTGYYTTGQFLLFGDEPKKCMDIDFKISLLESPHEADIDKMEYYAKYNPDNVLNCTVKAHQYNSWYMIYDGVHRTAANDKLGNTTVKADIIVKKPED